MDAFCAASITETDTVTSVRDTLPAVEFLTCAHQQLTPAKSPITIRHNRAVKAQVGARLRLTREETAVCPRIVCHPGPHSRIFHNRMAVRP